MLACDVWAQAYPGGVSGNISLWLKANATSGNLVVNTSGNVSQWQNELGSFSVTQTVATQQPVLQTIPATNADFNFNPNIKFNNASNTFLSNTATSPDLLGSGGTIFLVQNTFPNNSSPNPSALTYTAGTGYRYQVKPTFRIQTGVSGLGYTADFTGGPAINYPNVAAAIYSSYNTGPSFRSRRNGTTFNINNNGLSLYYPAVNTGLYLGCNGSNSELSNACFAEVILYNTTLSATDINKVESYLALKYGITLDQTAPGTSYTAANGTVVWDATINSGYAHNITGIGRDDNAALLQKQSRSVNNEGYVYSYNDNTGGVFPDMNDGNATAFAADNSFLVFGDNAGDTSLNTCAFQGKIVRMGRVWKVQRTGSVNTVTLAYNTGTFNGNIRFLAVSPDPLFPENATTLYSLSNAGGKTYASVSLADGDYFSFASDTLHVDLAVTDIICVSPDGGSIEATVSGGVPPYTYAWNTVPVQTTPVANINTPGTYTLTVQHGGAAGCSIIQSATVVSTVVQLVPQVITQNDVLCYGQSNGSFSLNVTNGTAPYEYQLGSSAWSGQSSFSDLSAAGYTVAVQDANGCTGSITVTIDQPDPLKQEDLVVLPDTCDKGGNNGSAAIVLSGGTSPYYFSLNGNTFDTIPVFGGLAEGDYTVAVHDGNGCSLNTSFEVTTIPCCNFFIPSAFSPNNDGRNDAFSILSNGQAKLLELRIFNRWGTLVFYSVHINDQWDGSFRSVPAEMGVYYYSALIECPNKQTRDRIKGEVTLIR